MTATLHEPAERLQPYEVLDPERRQDEVSLYCETGDGHRSITVFLPDRDAGIYTAHKVCEDCGTQFPVTDAEVYAQVRGQNR